MKRLIVCLLMLAVPASAQVVESGRTLADLISSHPCASGLTNRIARVVDCDAADDLGDGGGAFQCWALCDGTAPWEAVSIGGGGSGGTGDVVGPGSATDNAIARYDLTTGKLLQNSAVTIADTTGNLQWEGTTADTFEGNFTFADPTADWTVAFGADGGSVFPTSLYVQWGATTEDRWEIRQAGFMSQSSQAAGINFQILPEYVGSALRLSSGMSLKWFSAQDIGSGSADVGLGRAAAGVLRITNGDTGGAAMHLNPLASPPRTCDATAEGDIYSDTSHALCWCDASAWQKLSGAGTCA